MVNILPRAFFSELLLLTSALIAWFFVAWMVLSTGRDLFRAIKAKNESTWNFSDSLIVQGKGYFTAELWRLAETSFLVGIGVWSVLHSIDNKPVEFWNLEQNLRVDRVIAVLITSCKMMSSITARYFRRKANLLDGVLHD